MNVALIFVVLVCVCMCVCRLLVVVADVAGLVEDEEARTHEEEGLASQVGANWLG